MRRPCWSQVSSRSRLFHFMHVPTAKSWRRCFHPGGARNIFLKRRLLPTRRLSELRQLQPEASSNPGEHVGVERLREAGAWLTIDPQAIAGCFNTDKGI